MVVSIGGFFVPNLLANFGVIPQLHQNFQFMPGVCCVAASSLRPWGFSLVLSTGDGFKALLLQSQVWFSPTLRHGFGLGWRSRLPLPGYSNCSAPR
jgi:hypothetical protein